MSPILRCDLEAALRLHPGPAGGHAARRMAALLPENAAVDSYEELLQVCPPEALGLGPGAHAAALGPLFGEFE